MDAVKKKDSGRVEKRIRAIVLPNKQWVTQSFDSTVQMGQRLYLGSLKQGHIFPRSCRGSSTFIHKLLRQSTWNEESKRMDAPSKTEGGQCLSECQKNKVMTDLLQLKHQSFLVFVVIDIAAALTIMGFSCVCVDSRTNGPFCLQSCPGWRKGVVSGDRDRVSCAPRRIWWGHCEIQEAGLDGPFFWQCHNLAFGGDV